jgi:hypothetical protein
MKEKVNWSEVITYGIVTLFFQFMILSVTMFGIKEGTIGVLGVLGMFLIGLSLTYGLANVFDFEKQSEEGKK